MNIINGTIDAVGTSIISNQRQVFSAVEFALPSGERKLLQGLRVPSELTLHVRPGVAGRFAIQGQYLLGIRIEDRTYVHVAYAQARHYGYGILLGIATFGLGLLLLFFGPHIPGAGTVEAALRK